MTSSSYDAPVSSTLHSQNYDVFLSFRGRDSRRIFVDHFYSALVNRKIRTFLYDESLLRGGPLDASIVQAIQESRIAIIILSSNYTGFSRCLNEVACIMKCRDERGQIVIPLYYGVDPSDVRNQSWVRTRDFAKLTREHDARLVESWKKAIVDLSYLDGGWELNNTDNRHILDHRIEQIVDAISKMVFTGQYMKIPLQYIKLATNAFAKKNIIATGGFGSVYICQDKHYGLLAVKRLDGRKGQGQREFSMEVALLSAYKHENIVSLVGYCDEDREKILVYRYEKNGSLDRVLLNKNLTWIQRLQICLGASRGLKYLHDEVGPQHRVLHRDIKSSNILLDENWTAKISDFGLSKIALANVPYTFLYSNVCGTLGYTDPQYIKHCILSQKSDVYSFGVVLLEVLFGKLVSVAEHLDENSNFRLKIAKTHYESETLCEIINSDLCKQMHRKSLDAFSKVAFDCLKKYGEERPTMNKVAEELQKALDHQLFSVAT